MTTAASATPLIIPGGQRCGSTWLLNYLAADSRVGVRLPVRPEPKVFLDPAADDRTWWDRCRPGDQRDYAWIVEKSTSYLDHPTCAERIRRHLPGARVLIILRDPTERAISNWRFSTANGRERRPIDRALDPAEPEPQPGATPDPNPPSAPAHRYLPRGHYAEALAPWLDHLEGNVDVVILEELIADRRARQQLWDRLDLGGSAPASPGPANESTDPFKVDPNVRRRLHRYFAPHQESLERRLGRSLPWPSVGDDGTAPDRRP